MASARPKLPTPPLPKIVMAGGSIDVEKTLRSQHESIQALVENILRRGKAHGYAELDEDGDLAGYLKLSGGTLTGFLTLHADPTADLHAATKQYVDAGVALFGANLLHVRDEKTSGTDGGTFTSGAWQTRTLNTVKTNEIGSASVGSNQITLPAGTYHIFARANAKEVDTHQAKLYNVTDGADVLLGSNAQAASGDFTTSESWVFGRFTLAGSKALELQHRCTTTQATNGFGGATSWGTEIYAEVLIWKVS